MIYNYAIGHHNVQWTMTQSKSGFLLALGDLQKVDSRRRQRRHRPLSLLKVCRLIRQETLPIIYNKIRFDISFDDCLYREDQGLLKSCLRAKYQLQLTSGKSQVTRGLAQVVLSHVKHVCVFVNERNMSAYLWRMHILSTCLRHGMSLESLRFVSTGYTATRDDLWSAAEVLYFGSYKDTAVLELLHCDVTKKDVAEFERFRRCKNELAGLSRGCRLVVALGRVLSVSIKRRSGGSDELLS